jgi:transcriptional regulator with XRE-family HTH domain
VAARQNTSTTPEMSRRRLRLALREAREASGLTQRDVVKNLKWSMSKVIRIEAGAVGVSVTDVRALLEQYKVPAVDRGRFEDLALTSRGPSWTKAYAEYFSPQSLQLFALEQSARRISKHEPSFIPGLLQTTEYTEALLPRLGVSDERRLEALIGARAERQDLLHRERGPRTHFILGEAAVSRPVGGAAVMRRLFERLVELNEEDGIVIQVMPFAAGIHHKVGESFTVLEFEDEGANDALYLENAGQETISREDPALIAEYLIAFDDIAEAALPAADLRNYLGEVVKQRFSGDD